jgi:hypothetical protein
MINELDCDGLSKTINLFEIIATLADEPLRRFGCIMIQKFEIRLPNKSGFPVIYMIKSFKSAQDLRWAISELCTSSI